MGRRQTKDNQLKPPKRGGEQGFYVYCIGEQEALAAIFEEVLPAAIETDAGLEMVGASNLTAVVSPVPLADYGEQVLEDRLGDATWTAIRAMRHEKIVEHFARRASVVPLRFGTIYLERENVAQMLSQKQADLRAIIESLRGREEWGLNVYYDRARLMENITGLSPRLREMTQRAAASTPGQSYLLRKKIETMRETEARAEIKRIAGEIERELSKMSTGTRRLRVLKDEAAEHGEVAAKLAFLVERARFSEFRARAERLAREREGAGFRLELTGPWPAYNFAVRQESQS
jgi:hypothetical protein